MMLRKGQKYPRTKDSPDLVSHREWQEYTDPDHTKEKSNNV